MAYFFEDNDNDSDDQSASDLSPLIRRPSAQTTPTPYIHIITGYLSLVELLVLVAYMGSMVGLTLWSRDYENSTYGYEKHGSSVSPAHPDQMVAYFSMVHVGIWILVGILDRIVQWRHQSLRRKGYLKFYRQMRNIRRVPFIVVSIGNAALLFGVSLLYFYNIQQSDNYHKLHPVIILCVIVGCEMVVTLPCLAYYIENWCPVMIQYREGHMSANELYFVMCVIVRATIFNYLRQPPDVIQETYSGPQSPTASVTAVGFRDGEDLDELLERQADMIRYLQQHNANLGRRILELQSQTME